MDIYPDSKFVVLTDDSASGRTRKDLVRSDSHVVVAQDASVVPNFMLRARDIRILTHQWHDAEGNRRKVQAPDDTGTSILRDDYGAWTFI